MTTLIVCEDPQYPMCVNCTHRATCALAITINPEPLPTHWLSTAPHMPLVIDEEAEQAAFMDGCHLTGA